ncbi:ABC transporter ATP-binding protein [Pseudalkalibacillus caeni]|uniref:ABC transporter ATP-binding protein n=1 Tax=Exobacillus caeni TaxID=2574798 RepID=A0A5R9F948_9BACL|nr:ABC transporter ATP-binding protein [Pseudalkalibacillus caeni]TLS36225.1 ABC transporter ATP-binding protein [Pseudalkalibacillus caeni]
MDSVITVKQLRKQYGDVDAVKDVSFSVGKGEIFGIIGPNGAGKTTTIEILEGIRKRDGGEVQVLGMDPEKNRRNLNARIGVQFQSTAIQEKIKVKEALDLFSSFYPNNDNLGDLIEKLGLDEKMDVYFEDLSGGWKQRVTLALATLHSPEIVFLDEPSMGLDPQARRDLWDIIHYLRDRGSTIIVTTHYMEEAEKLCDRIAMIYGGKLEALGEPKQLLEDLATKYLSFYSRDADENILSRLPGVISLENTEGHYRIMTEQLQRTSYHLFKEGEERNWTIEGFQFERGTLDDLFVHLLHKEETA